MKTKLVCVLATLALVVSASADDQVRNAQTELKSLGFYYGEANGQSSAEWAFAIRRYQIRNGLEVTGALNHETLAALGMVAANNKPKKSAPPPPNMEDVAPPKPANTTKAQPPTDLRRDPSVEQSDKDFLQREENKVRNRDRTAADYSDPGPQPSAPPPPPRSPAVVAPPAPLDAPSADFPVLFAGTPFANAPVTVQRDTLRRAQGVLAERGYYRDVIDGLPGPATEEALLGYQRSERLTLTGRLDMDTLNDLRLLPRDNRDSGVRFGFELHIPNHVFRGVWVDRR
ncbi:Peptidoglycan-binding domain 1 protein [Chthoniobacter flavus Ellin428]|uniref:Peptidoglycan-binding domain 1 protein n=1 Tax=Chthoniobacter flavus Ellin428 TaxID=497964 RepID=B4D3H6_9BACT|nr:peptidoglycan-binding protein [Chthoniobacter flavus]EDY18806.1 Peptidoglycan-binding domain 1 protein [Chthoniobacter flavus Ellin428]TCO93403.1 putative peptidoglycan binding protein [Chthoniobacter flavus]